MATTRNPGRIIVLVTDNDDLEENVRNSVKELEDTLADFPEAKIFAGAEVKHRSSSTAAKTVLDPILAAAWNPVLIIVDAAVRADTGDLVPGDGAAAIEFLNWIEKKLPDVPVLVAAPEASEDIQRKVLSRRNVSLWGVEQDKSPKRWRDWHSLRQSRVGASPSMCAGRVPGIASAMETTSMYRRAISPTTSCLRSNT
jgi:hypothetical protein